MALLIPPEVMEVLNAQAAKLVKLAWEACEDAVDMQPGATQDEIDQARAVQAVVYSVNAVLQSMPLNQGGVLVAMGAVSGTVLGQCDGDRSVLYKMFSKQMAATLAEISAARMTPMGNA